MFKVSKGNTKLGAIYNINLPAGVTCATDAPCQKDGCYAKKGNYAFSNVKNCYNENLRTFQESPLQAENDILLQLPHVDSEYFKTYCRVHSSGDFVNMAYLEMICRIASKRPYMQFLAFTKKYDLINSFLHNGNSIPANLTIVFSYWKNYKMNNPYYFPVAAIDQHLDSIPDNGFHCGGKCDLCYKCWYMAPGETVIFKKH